MNVVYVATAGKADPTKASMPLHLAVNGSVEIGDDVSLLIGGDAAEIIVGDTPDTLEGVGLPPLRELLAKVRDHELPVFV